VAIALLRRGYRHFGTWSDALAAAEVNMANVTRHRPKNLGRDAMRLWIRNRKEAGQSMSFGDVCFENRDAPLQSSASSVSGAELSKRLTLCLTSKIKVSPTKGNHKVEQIHRFEHLLSVGGHSTQFAIHFFVQTLPCLNDVNGHG
jgi:hypothetical protein